MISGFAKSFSITHYCDAVLRFRWPVVAATALVAAAVASGALHLRTTVDNRIFFGADNPELKAFEALEAAYTEGNDLLVAVAPRSGEVFEPRTLQVIQDLTEALWRAPYSTRVNSITNFQHSHADGDDLVIEPLVPDANALDYAGVERVRDIALAEPQLAGILISASGSVAGIGVNFLLPDDSPAAIDEIVAYVRAIADDATRRRGGIDIYLTGNVMLMAAFGEARDQDTMTLIPVMFVVITAILLFLLRSVAATAMAALFALLSTGTAMGFAGWTGVVMNAGSAPAPLIILTIALAYSVHILIKFLDDFAAGASKRDAIANTVAFNLSPVSLTSLTTAIGFLSMNASDAPPFHDLGNIVAFGVVTAFVLSFTFVPAVLAILPVRPPAMETRKWHLAKALADMVVLYRRGLFWSMLAVIAVLATGIPRIELNDDWVRYFDQRFKMRRDTEFVLKNLTGIDILEFSVPADGEQGIFERLYLERLDRFAAWLRTQPEVVNVNVLSDVLKRLNKNLHGDDPDFYVIPETKTQAAQYLLLYEMSLPNGLDLNDRVNVDRSATRVTVIARRDGTNLPSKDLGPFAERVEGWLAANGGPAAATRGSGLSLMFAHMSARNIQTMLFGTAVATLLISVILIFALGSLKLGVASLVPNFVPGIMGFGLWGYWIGEIGVAVSVVSVMTFGIVVDDTIHFLTKYRKARAELGKSPEESIHYAFRSVGKALMVTTLILVAGFCVLAASGFKVSSSMGLLTAVTLALALAADFLFLPALLLRFDKNHRRAAEDLMVRRGATHPVELPTLAHRVTRYLDRISGGHPLIGRIPDQEAIELWSNDYLSLSGHPAIVKAQVNALRKGGDSLYMSAAFLGDENAHRAAERKTAAFVGTEDAVLCQSGWCANVGLVQAIANKSTPIYADIMTHASFWEGARSVGARTLPFRHNNPESLEARVRKSGPGIIVVDAIYSTDGSVCPLVEIAEIGARQGCVVVVDESHSIGIRGENGRGLVSALDLGERVHYRTFSLSKAFVTRAGMVTGPARVIEYFRYESRPAIFSSAVLPHQVAGLDAALSMIREQEGGRRQLRRKADYLRRSLAEMGYNVEDSQSQIMALEAGSEARTMVLRDALEERGVFGAVFCAPATPRNRSLIRFSVNAGLSQRELDRVVEVCRTIRGHVGMDRWRSTRRLASRSGEGRASRPIAPALVPASA